MCNAVNELFADEIAEMKVIIANKDSVIADKNALIMKLQNDRDSQLASKDSVIADKDALIAKLQTELEKYTKKQ